MEEGSDVEEDQCVSHPHSPGVRVPRALAVVDAGLPVHREGSGLPPPRDFGNFATAFAIFDAPTPDHQVEKGLVLDRLVIEELRRAIPPQGCILVTPVIPAKQDSNWCHCFWSLYIKMWQQSIFFSAKNTRI